MHALELWGLADNLSVVNTAILIAGGDPSEHYVDDLGERTKKTWQHAGFDAAFDALRNSIMTNKLQANLAHGMRGRHTFAGHDGIFGEVEFGPEEEKASFDLLIARNETEGSSTSMYFGDTKLNFTVDDIRGRADLFIWREPNWENSTIEVDAIKKWLAERGIYPNFFFPSGNQSSFLNQQNPRYSAKLACAVAAWKAVNKASRGKSVKRTIQDWVLSNGAGYGLANEGVVSPTAAEEIAKIVNWNIKGGATSTPEVDCDPCEKPASKVDNYGFGCPPEKLD